MVFSSLYFLFVFLPLAFLLYFITPVKYRNYTLLVESLFFYSFGEGKLVILLMFSSVFNYYVAKWIQKERKKGILLSLVVNLGILFCFKYLNFTLNNIIWMFGLLHIYCPIPVLNIILPIGISFYTFQALSYCIDVYYGKVEPSQKYINFATYLCMFPQLVAGPIVRYTDIEKQMDDRHAKLDRIASGVERFIIGLGKKVLIANTMAGVVDGIFEMQVNDLSSSMAWVGILAYTFQIFFDFSGYSDMAIGLGRIFGFEFLENFNYPYIAKSVKDFWRRWHISMSSWFKDYLYIPLGGNRLGNVRTYINLSIVFIVTGFWHGASWHYIAWGMFHGFFLVIERIGFGKVLEKIPVVFQHLYTLLVVTIGWVFFRSNTTAQAFGYIKKLFSFSSGSPETIWQANMLVTAFELVVFILAIFFSLPLAKKWLERHANNIYVQWGWMFILLMIFVCSVVFINSSGYNPFIYFRF
ncbi:MAG: MBOAT family protein [Paludibacteraceae bacterium]|nr:MBOAT family protein [Paludibacteraceae bacterium]